MKYDLLIAGDVGVRIIEFQFFWVALLAAWVALLDPRTHRVSITRGRHDIKWWREQSERTGA